MAYAALRRLSQAVKHSVAEWQENYKGSGMASGTRCLKHRDCIIEHSVSTPTSLTKHSSQPPQNPPGRPRTSSPATLSSAIHSPPAEIDPQPVSPTRREHI